MLKTLDSFSDFAFTMMGSLGTFHPSICWNCDQEFVRTYPGKDVCKQCDALEIYPLLEIPFARRSGVAWRRSGVAWIPDLLFPFLCFDFERAVRKRFLYCTLMARESLFRTRFTYCGNGMVGNISETEDILDRILCFV